MMTTNKDEGGDPADAPADFAMIGWHVVALIDFLGQSSHLAKWDFVPQSASQQTEWLNAVRASMVRVQSWRKEFEKQFSDTEEILMGHKGARYRSAPPEEQRQFDELRQHSLHHGYFSDTIVFYSPLLNEHGYLQVSNIAAFLGTCGPLLLQGLATKTVFRGAIEVGVLSRFPTGDPYGPALATAHYLESKIAQYPRIVVGSTLMSYLDAIEKSADEEASARVNKGVAALCRKLITRDDDGHFIVDYLNDTFARAGDDPAGWRHVQDTAFAVATSELERFRKEGDQKLVGRYERLVAYFKTHGSV
jgi:hypothetical protein